MSPTDFSIILLILYQQRVDRARSYFTVALRLVVRLKVRCRCVFPRVYFLFLISLAGTAYRLPRGIVAFIVIYVCRKVGLNWIQDDDVRADTKVASEDARLRKTRAVWGTRCDRKMGQQPRNWRKQSQPEVSQWNDE